MFNPKTTKEDLLLESYDYELPKELIAQEAIEPRDASRLLVIFNDGIWHTTFKSIIHFLNQGDVLVMNNSRVLKTKLIGRKATGGRATITLIKKLSSKTWLSFVHCKNPKIGTKLIFFGENENLNATIIQKDEKRFILEFEKPIEDFLSRYGHYTLPPYIKKELKNEERYQTIYAKEAGSLASPTAGLHFTKTLLDEIKNRGVKIAFVTLNVGLGTFEPVITNNILEHRMHVEQFKVTKENAEIINNAKRLIVVGTTSLRVLESLNKIDETISQTGIFIYPGYKFKHKYYGLITNFHLPRSTLIMLVSAIVGRERILKIYKRAVELKYRFFSLGDATFIVDDSIQNFENIHKNQNIELI